MESPIQKMSKPAAPPKKIIISASRRTDIPAFYMDWFMQGIDDGYFEVTNPFNHRVSTVMATPEHLHTIVFWSKDFRPFLEGGYGETLRQMGYHLFFNFTVNSESSWLEPRIPPLKDRIETLKRLADRFGPDSISWRFDPICFFRPPDGPDIDNLSDFIQIAECMGESGINRCITSFMGHYPKIKKRMASVPGFIFCDPPLAEKVRVIQWMESILSRHKISLYTCCEKEVTTALSADSGIQPSQCIPGRLLTDLFGGNISLRKDAGQRVKQGCGCTVSSDIGSYHRQPCRHNCLFCYANPSSTVSRPIKNTRISCKSAPSSSPIR
jgi:hypothetical protein